MATRLRTGRFGVRIPVGGRGFSPNIQIGFGVKRQGRKVIHSSPSSTEELCLRLPFTPSWSVQGNLYLFIIIIIMIIKIIFKALGMEATEKWYTPTHTHPRTYTHTHTHTHTQANT
jgi:hypothetical protein